MLDRRNWTVYVLRIADPAGRKLTGRGSRLYYVGITNNLERRFARHNRREVKSTHWATWELLAWMSGVTQSVAVALEKWLKSGDSRQRREQFVATMGHDQIPFSAKVSWLNKTSGGYTIMAVHAMLKGHNCRNEDHGHVVKSYGPDADDWYDEGGHRDNDYLDSLPIMSNDLHIGEG